MDVSLSTARWLAPASFVYNCALQQYGIFSTPNIGDVHDANLSFFSPHVYFIAAFFLLQQLLQLAWLFMLYRQDPRAQQQQQRKKREEQDEMLRYVPVYVVGNVCLGTWVVFWKGSYLRAADAFMLVNACAQFWFCMVRGKRMDTGSMSSVLTHAVSETFAGIALLDLLHNSSAAFFREAAPSVALQVATGVGFAALSACSEWILGACLVYDLVALSVGQSTYDASWSRILGLYAAGSAVIVLLRNLLRRTYTKDEYALAAQDDVGDRA